MNCSLLSVIRAGYKEDGASLWKLMNDNCLSVIRAG